MKQLYHTMLRNGVDLLSFIQLSNHGGDYLGWYDVCKYCGKNGHEIYEESNQLIGGGLNAEQQLKIINEYSKCLTEEEYIIKQIIE